MPSTIADFTGDSRPSGTQVNYKCCPVCNDIRWKVYLNVETGAWFCHAGGHGSGGKVEVGDSDEDRGLKLLSRLEQSPGDVSLEWPEMDLPPFVPLSTRARRYLHKRGLTDETIKAAGLVEMSDPEKFRIIIPFFGRGGVIEYYSTRVYSQLDEGPKYLTAPGKHPFYVLPRWRKSDTIVLVEGVMDALVTSQWTEHTVVALCGKSLPRYLAPDLRGLVAKNAIICLDSDALRDALRLRAKLGGRYSVRIVTLPVNQDPASMGEAMRELLL